MHLSPLRTSNHGEPLPLGSMRKRPGTPPTTTHSARSLASTTRGTRPDDHAPTASPGSPADRFVARVLELDETNPTSTRVLLPQIDETHGVAMWPPSDALLAVLSGAPGDPVASPGKKLLVRPLALSPGAGARRAPDVLDAAVYMDGMDPPTTSPVLSLADLRSLDAFERSTRDVAIQCELGWMDATCQQLRRIGVLFARLVHIHVDDALSRLDAALRTPRALAATITGMAHSCVTLPLRVASRCMRVVGLVMTTSAELVLVLCSSLSARVFGANANPFSFYK